MHDNTSLSSLFLVIFHFFHNKSSSFRLSLSLSLFLNFGFGWLFPPSPRGHLTAHFTFCKSLFVHYPPSSLLSLSHQPSLSLTLRLQARPLPIHIAFWSEIEMRDREAQIRSRRRDTLRKHNLQWAGSVLLSARGSGFLFCIEHPESSLSCFHRCQSHRCNLLGQFNAMTSVRNPAHISAKSSGFLGILVILNLRIPPKSSQFVDSIASSTLSPLLQFDVGAR